jgi:AraC-like DNA-binding protein
LNILAGLSTDELSPRDAYKTALIIRGAELINSDFSSPDLTVEAAAAASSVSPEYFRRIYKAVYGMAPHKAIEERRIDKACRLLEAGYFNISRVAEECGFSDAKYFSTLFRKRTGLSPRGYKKRYNN